MLKNKPQDSLYENIKRAIANRKVELVKNLINSAQTILDENHTNHIPLLQIAVIFYQNEIMLALLQSKKLNVDYRDGKGVTALVSALTDGNFEAVKLLLQAGAILDESYTDDKLAKSIAIKKNPEIAELLEQSKQGKLESLPLLQMDSKLTNTFSLLSVSDIDATKREKLVAPLAELTSPSNTKSVPLWQNITGSLKRRIRPDTPSGITIKMSSNLKTPIYPPSNNHPHAD